METNRTIKRSALAVAGAAALASGAFAVGSQAGDGSALAGQGARAAAGAYGAVGPGPGARGRFGAGLGEAAEALGVTEARLRTALGAVHEAEHEAREGDRRPGEAELARALGISVERLREAVEGLHTAREHAISDTLAGELDLDRARVRAAFQAAEEATEDDRPRRGRDGGAFVAALAQELDVTAARLRRAFRAIHDDLAGDRRDRGDHGAELAEALGVTEERLEAAFEQAQQARRTAFAAALAEELDVDVARVREVLDDLPFGLGRGGPGGPGHHRGGPGGPFGR